MDEFDSIQSDGPQAPLPVGSTALETAILSRLDDDKAQDIVLIDLKGKSPMADTMIIASGRSHRHVGALADHLQRTLKETGLGKVKVSAGCGGRHRPPVPSGSARLLQHREDLVGRERPPRRRPRLIS